jgi:DNA polymerase zeta
MESIPLVMEPESRLYVDPVIVLDFQSLYPSLVIAYNLCYCTLLGRPSHASGDGSSKLGAFSLNLPPGTLTGPLAPDR